MTRNQWIAQTLFAAGMIALGILAFVYGAAARSTGSFTTVRVRRSPVRP